MIGGSMNENGSSAESIENEIEFARAITAVMLAVKLDLAEKKADDAYERLVQPSTVDIPTRMAS